MECCPDANFNSMALASQEVSAKGTDARGRTGEMPCFAMAKPVMQPAHLQASKAVCAMWPGSSSLRGWGRDSCVHWLLLTAFGTVFQERGQSRKGVAKL